MVTPSMRLQAREFAETIVEAAVAPPPDLLNRFAELEARVAALEACQGESHPSILRGAPPDDEDGAPRVSGRWCRMKEAMRLTTIADQVYSRSAGGGRVRFDFEGAHRLIDISSVPRKISSASAQSAHCK
jgi:hypothetical protein